MAAARKSLTGRIDRRSLGRSSQTKNARLMLFWNDIQLVKPCAATEIGVVIPQSHQALTMASGPESSLGIVLPLSPQRQGGGHLIVRCAGRTVGVIHQLRCNGTSG